VNSSSNFHWIRTAAAAGLMVSLMGGCYLADSARGQLALMSKREPIKRVLANPATPPALRAQLAEVTSIRDFASRELLLPDNGSYRSYADVGRPYVVWNVVAAPEFSVDAKEWCYPIVGCVAYRGYFAESKARAFAAGLRSKGFDVSVGGVAAYSTLGHFDDPILNTMVGWSDVEFAAIIFHELTHQLLYVPATPPSTKRWRPRWKKRGYAAGCWRRAEPPIWRSMRGSRHTTSRSSTYCVVPAPSSIPCTSRESIGIK
jgi:predicted aminopeptidase